MYSANIPEISDQPVEFGTSGLLYQSNKLMYDRETLTLWRQFTGKPAVGPLVGSGIELEVLPISVTTWGAWRTMHPDTTVLSIATGIYPAESYLPESDHQSVYYFVRISPSLSFPAWPQSDTVPNKTIVLGVNLGGVAKAYPEDDLRTEPVLNDTLGGIDLVVVTDPEAGGSPRLPERWRPIRADAGDPEWGDDGGRHRWQRVACHGRGAGPC